MKKFSKFCKQFQVGDPFPVTKHLCLFAAFLADDALAPQTIKLYLAAIRNTELSFSLLDPRKRLTLPVLK